ncbi:protein of unknown function [Rhodovastum atsumiense]|nr:protein of unknown function [Rhodovastum atsumiense]
MVRNGLFMETFLVRPPVPDQDRGAHGPRNHLRRVGPPTVPVAHWQVTRERISDVLPVAPATFRRRVGSF